MFKIRKLSHRPWPVPVTLYECDADSGEVKTIEGGFVANFKVFTEKDLDAIRKDVYGDEGDAEIRRKTESLPVGEMAEMEAKYFARILKGWSKLCDENGTPVPYSEEVLHSLCCGPDGPAFRAALNGALVQIRLGLAPAKNFATSPSPGQKTGEESAEMSSSET